MAQNTGQPAVPSLTLTGLGAASQNEPKVITPKAMKKARAQKAQKRGPGRRMSLMSAFKAEGTGKVQRMEKMVELLTRISSARETEHLISTVVDGVFGMLSPECATVSMWVAQLNKTYTKAGGGMEEDGPGDKEG